MAQFPLLQGVLGPNHRQTASARAGPHPHGLTAESRGSVPKENPAWSPLRRPHPAERFPLPWEGWWWTGVGGFPVFQSRSGALRSQAGAAPPFTQLGGVSGFRLAERDRGWLAQYSELEEAPWL